ncbi:MAG: isoprenylcysteine carboxyl methyltransferase [Litorilinea sp.]|nr:MAG: isoprenylcysteine carboxyl methyltransferase [Litorilinea sp.]
MNGPYDYGYWTMAIVMSLVFIVFAFSFTRPKHWRDWRTFGTFAAFIVALFTEMYGFPLTIYLLSGWLTSRYPNLNLFAHDTGHLWQTLFGIGEGDSLAAHFNVLHVLSNLLIAGGVILIMSAWRVLYRAHREQRLATTGPYAYVRHPQYVGFVAVLLGFLVQWPTLLTLAMFPVLVWMYARLARIEEHEVRARFGAAYDAYAAQLPRFIPRRGVRYENPGKNTAEPVSSSTDLKPVR